MAQRESARPNRPCARSCRWTAPTSDLRHARPLYLMQDKTEEALRNSTRSASSSPNRSDEHGGAMPLQSKNRMKEAQLRYERVIAIDRQAPVAATPGLAVCRRRRQPRVALQWAQTARLRLPNAPAVADTLAGVYFKKQAVRPRDPRAERGRSGGHRQSEYQYTSGRLRGPRRLPKARVAWRKPWRPFGSLDRGQKALAALPRGMTHGVSLSEPSPDCAGPHRHAGVVVLLAIVAIYAPTAAWILDRWTMSVWHNAPGCSSHWWWAICRATNYSLSRA